MPTKPRRQTKKQDESQEKHMDKEHEKAVKTVAKGAGIAFIGLILGKLFAYLTRVFIARSMGPEAYGLISMGLAIVSILATISLFGLNPGLTRFIAFYRGKKEMGKVRGSILSSFKITLPISIVFSVLLFVFSKQISFFFSKPELVSIIQIFSIALPFSVATGLFHSIFLGFKQVKQKVYTVEIGKNLSTLLLVAVFFYLGFNILGTTLGFVLGFFFSALIGLCYMKSKISPYLKKIKTIPATRELIYFSWPLLMVGTLVLVMSWTDVLMLGYFDTAANVGIYSAALNTCVFLGAVSTAFGFIFIPLISELYSQNKKEEIRKIYKTSTRWMFSIIFPMFLIFVLFPDNILRILFGEEFVLGSLTLVILTFGNLIIVISGLSRETLTAIGKTKINMYLTFITAISNFFINLFLIPIYGMIGAAIATSSSVILYQILSLFFLYKKIKIQPYDKNYFRPFFISLLSIGIFYFILKFLFKSTSFSVLVISFIIFIPFYGFLFLITKGLTKEDVLILKTIERKTNLGLGWLRNIIKKFI